MCTVARGSSTEPWLERTTLTVTVVVGERVEAVGAGAPDADGRAGGESRMAVSTS